MALPIQLAIQGGGAKICCLFAVMEALQELEKNNVVRVTRIAGTSAGALAGAFFAAGVDVKALRKRLAEGEGYALLENFKTPGRLAMGWHLLRGTSFWAEEVLKEWVEENLNRDQEEEAKRIRRIKDFKEKRGVELLVVATSLSSARRTIAPDDDFVANALLDSAGLPFCFRNWKRPKPDVVDGGICNNFPWEELGQASKSMGEIVGISFAPSRPQSPDGLISFTKALLDTAIDNSIEQGRVRLGRDYIFSIDSVVDTFDFDAALSFLTSDGYVELRNQAKKFFDDFVGRRQSITVDWAAQNQVMMSRLGQIYRSQHKLDNLHFLHCAMEVQANCLLAPPSPDNVTYSMSFRTLDDPVYCFGIGVAQSHLPNVDETKTTWEAYDPDGKVIEVIGMPMRDPGDETERLILLSFNPVLPPKAGPFKLIFSQFIDGAMQPLAKDGKDEISYVVSRSRMPIEQMDLVLYVPATYGANVEFAQKAESEPGRYPADTSRYQRPGFRKIVWCGRNVSPNKAFAVAVLASGRSQVDRVSSRS